MILLQWKDEMGLTIPALAGLLGVPVNTMKAYLYGGVRNPSLSVVASAQRLTDGAVGVEDWLGLREKVEHYLAARSAA